MFSPPLGHLPEDPATGSASAALGALLADAMGIARGELEIVQGLEMGRRSEIGVRVLAPGGPVRIRGFRVEVCVGEMRI